MPATRSRAHSEDAVASTTESRKRQREEQEEVEEEPLTIPAEEEDAEEENAEEPSARQLRRRRRGVEPTRYAQQQAQERLLEELKYQQLALLRKGAQQQQRHASSNNNGSSATGSGAKRSRAEERRHARIARRRNEFSPEAASMSPLKAPPRMQLDASGPRTALACRLSDSGDLLQDVVLHPTAWRRLRLAPGRPAPVNVFRPISAAEPFAEAADAPLGHWDPELAAACALLPPAALRHHHHHGVGRPEAFLPPSEQARFAARVQALVAEAAPRVAACHQRRVQELVAGTRAQVRECLRRLPRLRQQLLRQADAFEALDIPRVEHLAAARILRDRPEAGRAWLARVPPVYVIGRGESAQTERRLTPERVTYLGAIAPIGRATTCIGVRGTLPVDDDPILRVVPAMTSTTKPETTQFGQFAGHERLHLGPLSALDDELHEYTLRYVLRGVDGDPRAFAVLRDLGGVSQQPLADYHELQRQHHRERSRVNRQDTTGSGTLDTISTDRNASSGLTRRLRGDHQRSRGVRRSSSSPWATRRALQKLFCRRCYAYNCQYHGIQQPIARSRVDPQYPVVRATRYVRRFLEDVEIEAPVTTAPEGEGSTTTTTATTATEDPELDPNHKTNPSDDRESATATTTTIAISTTTVTVEDTTTTTTTTTTAHDDLGTGDQNTVVRRSVRSRTAACTLASTLLSSQQSTVSRRRTSSTHASSSSSSSSTSSSSSPSGRVRADPSEYFGLSDVYRRAYEALGVDLAKGTCGAACHKLDASTEPEERAADDDHVPTWTDAEDATLRLAERTVGPSPCLLARLLRSHSCRAIHRRLALLAERDDAPDNELDGGCFLGPPQLAASLGTTRDHLLRTRFQRMKDRGANHQFTPCAHAGPCNAGDCACMRRDHFCERACGCPADCANRFVGCHCPRGQCRTSACPCVFAGRECDPDLCGSCGAEEVPVLVHRRRDGGPGTTATTSGCGNTNLLYGRYRRVGMAASETHGWGAFAREPIAAGEFIYEYTGELLSQDEAERRGNVYDRNMVSFLFDLNEDVVVDAARKGNKSKFANHASDTTANCLARIMLVNGDHRIGLFAKRAIAAGEELFFDYGYHHGVVPDWSQARIRSGGIGGGGRGGASVPTVVAEEDEEDEQQVDNGEDEDDDGVMEMDPPVMTEVIDLEEEDNVLGGEDNAAVPRV